MVSLPDVHHPRPRPGVSGPLLVVLLLIGLVPSAAVAGPDRDLTAAARCYAAGDMACVIQRLENAPGDAAERWRMLAFAAARMDRAGLSRRAFAAWIGLDVGHRLDRQSTAPGIWRHYAAALLQVHGDQLDLEPRLEPPAVLPPAAVTGLELPHFAPPPRSARDHSRDYALCLGATVGMPLDGAGMAPGVALGLGLHLSALWRLAAEVGWLRHPDGGDGLGGDPPGTLIHAALRADVLWLSGAAGELGFGLAVGGGQLSWDGTTSEAVAAIRPLLRYAWPARRQGSGLAVWAEVGHQMLVGGEGSRQLPSVGLGVELRPGAASGSARSARPGR